MMESETETQTETPKPRLSERVREVALSIRHTYSNWRAWLKQRPWVLDLGFFFLGFCFDLLLLKSIDSVPMLIHQGSYVLLLSALILLDHHYHVTQTLPGGWWGKLLAHRDWVIHFLFGTLFNAFFVFYFRASVISSLSFFIFIPLLALVLALNELPMFRNLGPLMRMALWSFTCTSFWAYLLPLLFGFLSAWLFVLAVFLSTVSVFGLWYLSLRLTADFQWNFWRAVAPSLGVQLLLLLLYFSGVVPPVPLSLKWIGVYHDVRKPDGTELLYVRDGLRFWEHGAETFLARPQDRLNVWMRIFAPKRFRDDIYVAWQHKNEQGQWMQTDRIPLKLSHSGQRGWTGHTYKVNYASGEWRVEVLTADARLLGSIEITVLPDNSTQPREFLLDKR
ncbi:MAG: DUF2914 domain-containing protein [Proteobacteria bacterium]|nr:DUF2914 domain-containing protein [Cystobacterineae bacterium]MCL2258250.1 DUF2914 domain-containing protein [Cystobacterineae bacterium]MCL2315411.1 DUF2914 domain-containing protein [Pseudomonadota bacterium]